MRIKNKYIQRLISTQGFFILFYKVMLDITFLFIISPLYDYRTFMELHINSTKLAESCLILILLILVTPNDEKRFSNVFLAMQLEIMIIPMLSIYGLRDGNRTFMYAVCLSYFLQTIILKKEKEIKVSIRIKENQFIFWGIIAFLIFLSVGLMLIKYGIPDLKALKLENVYEVRQENTLSFPLQYFIPWLAGVILPILFILGIEKKKLGLTVGTLALQFYIFLTFGNKSHLFALVLVFGVYMLKKKNLLLKGLYIGMPFLVIVSDILYLINYKFLIILSLFTRRVLMVPAILKFEYYEFFSQHKKVYFADGIIGKLFGIESPYPQNVSKVIAEYIGIPESSCNTGYWGDAYANMGIIGVVLFSVILALII